MAVSLQNVPRTTLSCASESPGSASTVSSRPRSNAQWNASTCSSHVLQSHSLRATRDQRLHLGAIEAAQVEKRVVGVSNRLPGCRNSFFQLVRIGCAVVRRGQGEVGKARLD